MVTCVIIVFGVISRLNHWYSLKQANGFVDHGRRVMENAVIPTVWEAGCTLLIALSERCVISRRARSVSNLLIARSAISPHMYLNWRLQLLTV